MERLPKGLRNKILGIKPNIIELIGSDAHRKKEVTTFINEYPSIALSEPSLSEIFVSTPKFVRTKKRSILYFKLKKFQKSTFYQFVLNIFSKKLRKNVKSLLRLDK